MDDDPISAYYDSDSEERKARKSREQGNQEGKDEQEKTLAAETFPQEMAREEIDLNETAKKQGLMTDEEFVALLDGISREEGDTATMAEGPDLTSRAVGEGEEAGAENISEGLSNQPVDQVEEEPTRAEEPESVIPQMEAGESGVHIEAEETEARPEVPNPVAPPVVRPKAVKRKLVLKNDPKAERPQPKRVSQRCLGKWAASKATPNTEADPMEIVSEEEGATPTKPGEESLPATDLEDVAVATEAVSPTPSGQGKETDGMAEGLDLHPSQ